MQKSLDRKLAAIHADPSGAKDFILADAKDADMAFGMGAPGLSPESHAGEARMRTLAEYRENIRQIVRQGLVDIMLMSSSTNDALTIQEGLFADSHVTPAARANDTSDIFVVRGGKYVLDPSRPFRTATIDQIQCGRVECSPNDRQIGANLGLYSITFNNRLSEDLASLEAYRAFRIDAEQKGFEHFLEVFDPNAGEGLDANNLPGFINDSIARTLGGVAQAGRPQFLKVVYHGPKAMEELVAYDPHLVVGILGGAAGTTYDAFKLLAEAQKYGARVALFGRKINQAESQLAFVQFLRMIADREVSPEDAVRAYHGVLGRLGIKPHRKLDDDLTLQTGVMSYSGRSSTSLPAAIASPAKPASPTSSSKSSQKHDCGCHGSNASSNGSNAHDCSCKHEPEVKAKASAVPSSNGSSNGSMNGAGQPDFSRMTSAEKLAYNQARRDQIYGRYDNLSR